MDDETFQQVVRDGTALLGELNAAHPGRAFPALLDRFDGPEVHAALLAAYEMGYQDGESEREMYPEFQGADLDG